MGSNGWVEGGSDPALAIGEIHTGLLQSSTALRPGAVRDLLALVPGEPIRLFERPIPYAASPPVLTGLDCNLVGASGAVARVIGTVLSQATLTGGHIAQSSSFARPRPQPTGRRYRWSYYLARPGVLETIGRAAPADLGLGFVQAGPAPGTADLGAISANLLDIVQASGLDRRPPFRVARTQLRWTATTGPSSHVHFTVEGASLRTLRLSVPKVDLGVVVGFCEDVALHDWLLTCLLQVIDRTRTGTHHAPQTANRLRPVIDHLVHLWMPAARPDDVLLHLWQSLDRRAGFSRQWTASVGWIRDQVGVGPLPAPDPFDGSGRSRA